MPASAENLIALCQQLIDVGVGLLGQDAADPGRDGIEDADQTAQCGALGFHRAWLGGVLVDRLYACPPDEPATAWLYAVEMAEQLVTGDLLPSLYGTDLEGNEVDITASVAGRWAVVLFYRGDW